jgi:hypothetical protein
LNTTRPSCRRATLALLAAASIALTAAAVAPVAEARPNHDDKAAHGRPPHAGKKGGPRADTGAPGKGAARSDGQRTLADYLAAGFTAAALHELLGGDRAALETGARPLPPGIAKNLARGKPLPPGIAKRQPAPRLLQVLPRVSGHHWLEVGRDLVLVEIASEIVRDIVRDVLR